MVFNKYGRGKKTVLEPEDDAATVNWGATWRLPTAEEWAALTDDNNFLWTSTTIDLDNGDHVLGMMVESKVEGYEGNKIFIPRASGGLYWSSSLHTTTMGQSAWCFNLNEYQYIGATARYEGLAVRAVSK